MIQPYFDFPIQDSDENQKEQNTDVFLPDIEQYLEQALYLLGSLFSVGKDYDPIKLAEAEAFVPLTPDAISSEIINQQFQQLQEKLDANLPFVIVSDLHSESFAGYLMGMIVSEANKQTKRVTTIGPKAIDIPKLVLAPFMNLLLPYMVLALNDDDPEKKKECLRILGSQIIDAHGRYFSLPKSKEDLQEIADRTLEDDNLAINLFGLLAEGVMTAVEAADYVTQSKVVEKAAEKFFEKQNLSPAEKLLILTKFGYGYFYSAYHERYTDPELGLIDQAQLDRYYKLFSSEEAQKLFYRWLELNFDLDVAGAIERSQAEVNPLKRHSVFVNELYEQLLLFYSRPKNKISTQKNPKLATASVNVNSHRYNFKLFRNSGSTPPLTWDEREKQKTLAESMLEYIKTGKSPELEKFASKDQANLLFILIGAPSLAPKNLVEFYDKLMLFRTLIFQLICTYDHTLINDNLLYIDQKKEMIALSRLEVIYLSYFLPLDRSEDLLTVFSNYLKVKKRILKLRKLSVFVISGLFTQENFIFLNIWSFLYLFIIDKTLFSLLNDHPYLKKAISTLYKWNYLNGRVENPLILDNKMKFSQKILNLLKQEKDFTIQQKKSFIANLKSKISFAKNSVAYVMYYRSVFNSFSIYNEQFLILQELLLVQEKVQLAYLLKNIYNSTLSFKEKTQLLNQLKFILIITVTTRKLEIYLEAQKENQPNNFSVSKALKRVLEIPKGGFLTVDLSSKNSYRLTNNEIELLNNFFNLNDCLTIVQRQELQSYIRDLKLKNILKNSLKRNVLNSNCSYESSKIENLAVSTFDLGTFLKLLELIYSDENFTNLNKNFNESSNHITLRESKISVLRPDKLDLSNSVYDSKDTVVISFGKEGAIILSEVEPEFSKSDIENVQKQVDNDSIHNSNKPKLPLKVKSNK